MSSWPRRIWRTSRPIRYSLIAIPKFILINNLTDSRPRTNRRPITWSIDDDQLWDDPETRKTRSEIKSWERKVRRECKISFGVTLITIINEVKSETATKALSPTPSKWTKRVAPRSTRILLRRAENPSLRPRSTLVLARYILAYTTRPQLVTTFSIDQRQWHKLPTFVVYLVSQCYPNSLPPNCSISWRPQKIVPTYYNSPLNISHVDQHLKIHEIT